MRIPVDIIYSAGIGNNENYEYFYFEQCIHIRLLINLQNLDSNLTIP